MPSMKDKLLAEEVALKAAQAPKETEPEADEEPRAKKGRIIKTKK